MLPHARRRRQDQHEAAVQEKGCCTAHQPLDFPARAMPAPAYEPPSNVLVQLQGTTSAPARAEETLARSFAAYSLPVYIVGVRLRLFPHAACELRASFHPPCHKPYNTTHPARAGTFRFQLRAQKTGSRGSDLIAFRTPNPDEFDRGQRQ